ncbi:unnamed protein product, partial [Brassica rapa subsp. narinosa]
MLRNLDSHRNEYRCAFRSQTNHHIRHQTVRISTKFIDYIAKNRVLLTK